MNMPICLNPSPITDELLSLDLTLVDIIIVNELEGCALSGLKEPYEIIQKLHAQYPKGIVILTLGSRGSIAIKPGDNEPIVIPSESCDCIDSTAAGDTFAGYVLAGLTISTNPLGYSKIKFHIWTFFGPNLGQTVDSEGPKEAKDNIAKSLIFYCFC